MYDISEIEITGKDMAILVLIVFILLVGAGFAGYLLGWERAEDVYCHGTGVGTVSNELGQVGADISNATAGIEAAAGHADQVGAGIESAKESAIYIEGAAATSAELIADSKRIIEAIRQRANTHKIAN